MCYVDEFCDELSQVQDQVNKLTFYLISFFFFQPVKVLCFLNRCRLQNFSRLAAVS